MLHAYIVKYTQTKMTSAKVQDLKKKCPTRYIFLLFLPALIGSANHNSWQQLHHNVPARSHARLVTYRRFVTAVYPFVAVKTHYLAVLVVNCY